MIAAMLTACGDPPPSVAEALSDACSDARGLLAAAPTPVHPDAEETFMKASDDAAQTVADVAADQAPRGDDRTLADLAWQLHRFPAPGKPDEVLSVTHEAQAAIMRIDGFARTLRVWRCGAATWRPDDWRLLADRHGERPSDAAFRRDLDRLCAQTFPAGLHFADGASLLDALVANTPARHGSPEEVKARVIARLDTMTSGPSEAARFIRDFSSGLPEIHPSANLESEYLALLAAFMRLDSAVPSAVPNNLPPDVRERVHAALDELQRAWAALDITC